MRFPALKTALGWMEANSIVEKALSFPAAPLADASALNKQHNVCKHCA